MYVSCKIDGKVYSVSTVDFRLVPGSSDSVVTGSIITSKQGISARFFGAPYISFYSQAPYMLEVICRKSDRPFQPSFGDNRVFLDSAICLMQEGKVVPLASLEYFGSSPFSKANPIAKDKLLPHAKAMMCFHIANFYVYMIDFFLPDARRTMFSLVFDKEGRFLGTASSPYPIDGLVTFNHPVNPMIHSKLTFLGGVPLCS